MNELIRKLGDEVKNGKMTWQEVANKVNQEYDTDLSSEAVRKVLTNRELWCNIILTNPTGLCR